MLIHLPPPLVLVATRFIGVVVRDVVLTRDEIRELTESLLVSPEPPTTPTQVQRVGRPRTRPTIGRRYSSELERNFRSVAPSETR